MKLEGVEWFERPKPGSTGTRVIPPTLGICKQGLYLNRTATTDIGEDKRWVVLGWEEKEQSIVMWFWKDKGDSKIQENKFYALTRYPKSGIVRISSRAFIIRHDLVARAKKLGRVSFRFRPHPDQRDMFLASLNV